MEIMQKQRNYASLYVSIDNPRVSFNWFTSWQASSIKQSMPINRYGAHLVFLLSGMIFWRSFFSSGAAKGALPPRTGAPAAVESRGTFLISGSIGEGCWRSGRQLQAVYGEKRGLRDAWLMILEFQMVSISWYCVSGESHFHESLTRLLLELQRLRRFNLFSSPWFKTWTNR